VLRGSSVSFNPRRVGQIAVGVVVITLVVLIVVLTLAGIHSNDQFDRLHADGRPVTVTVTACQGLLGGSGSNAAGDSCRGTYVLAGHKYSELLPGTAFYGTGTKVLALAVPGDPALVSPRAVIDTQRSSAGVFVGPVVLGICLLAIGGIVVWRWRSGLRARAVHGDVS
jgi:hypothetical protein